MKKILLFLILSFVLKVSAAQPSEYFVDHWYLHSFTFADGVVEIRDLDIAEGPSLIIEADYSLHGFGFCNDFYGEYEYIDPDPLGDNDHFIPRNVVIETVDCGDVEAMENYFFLPFVEEKTADVYEANLSGDEKQIVLQYHFTYGYQVYRNYPALGKNNLSLKNLILYPNPATDKLIIQSALPSFNSITITTITGRVALRILENTSKTIDISSLKSGMYFIRIDSSEALRSGKQGSITKKFVKY